jgi:hypothetical protein
MDETNVTAVDLPVPSSYRVDTLAEPLGVIEETACLRCATRLRSPGSVSSRTPSSSKRTVL